MHQRWKSAVGAMAVGMMVLSAARAGAQDAKQKPEVRRLQPSGPRSSAMTSAATQSTGTVDVAVDEGARGTRLYRYDKNSGKLTLVKQLSQKESASATAGFKALAAAESSASLLDTDKGGAVAPEGKPPKGGGPPGGDVELYSKTDLANIRRELANLKLDASQVKVSATQARR
jgi:hypothetical protein